MSVNLRVGPIAYPVGRTDFLGSFFDTVAVRLEGGERGSRFPTIAALYRDGELSPDAAELARAELVNVERELRQYPPADVVWDINKPDAVRRGGVTSPTRSRLSGTTSWRPMGASSSR